MRKNIQGTKKMFRVACRFFGILGQNLGYSKRSFFAMADGAQAGKQTCFDSWPELTNKAAGYRQRATTEAAA